MVSIGADGVGSGAGVGAGVGAGLATLGVTTTGGTMLSYILPNVVSVPLFAALPHAMKSALLFDFTNDGLNFISPLMIIN